MGSIYVICSRQCPNGDGIYTLLYALYKYSTSITNQPTNQPAAIPSSDETGRYARISPVAILTGSVSLRASRMSAAGFGNTRPITPHHVR